MTFGDLMIIYWPVWLFIIAYGLTWLPKLLDIIQGTPGQSEFEAFIRDGQKRGASYSDMMHELNVREIALKLRADASNAVAVDVPNWKLILDHVVEKCLKENSIYAPDIKAMFGGLSYHHILYPAEAAMVDRYMKLSAYKVTDPDLMRASLRIT